MIWTKKVNKIWRKTWYSENNFDLEVYNKKCVLNREKINKQSEREIILQKMSKPKNIFKNNKRWHKTVWGNFHTIIEFWGSTFKKIWLICKDNFIAAFQERFLFAKQDKI